MTHGVGGEELVFLPLGGAGEIGMNLNLYGYGRPERHRWLMVDLGITFGNGSIPGVDVMMPDPGFIVERRDRLEAIVLTHAHEDHLGAVPYLWPLLRCPVYATSFALAILRSKLASVPWGDQVPLHLVEPDKRLQLGPFALEFIGMTHSIPEAQSIAIHTDKGIVLHSGDWKLDPEPVVGAASDEGALRRIGDEGVLATICDSTNVFVNGWSGSEGGLLRTLSDEIAKCPNRVFVTCFSTNIARVQTIASAARNDGRSVVVAGASLARNCQLARDCGYLTDLDPFVDPDMFGYLPKNKTVVICTGGQGEHRAALARIVAGEYPKVSISEGDTVIFSTRVIPGNERTIGELQNRLLRQGVSILNNRSAAVHVSGHPARGELERLYALIRPRVAVPVHGEWRHLQEHAALATAQGVEQAVIAENGSMVRLAPEPPEIVQNVSVGRVVLDGGRVVPLKGAITRSRTKVLYQGAAMVTVAVSSATRTVVDVQLSTIALLEDNEHDLLDAVSISIRKAVDEIAEKNFNENASVRETIRLVVRRSFRQMLDKRPVIHVHLVRV